MILILARRKKWCGGRDLNSRTPTRFSLRDKASRRQGSEPCAFNLAWQPPQSCLNGPFGVFNHIARADGIPRSMNRKANFPHPGSEVRHLLSELVSVVKIITYAHPMETRQSHSLMPSCPHDGQCEDYNRSHNGGPSNEQ